MCAPFCSICVSQKHTSSMCRSLLHSLPCLHVLQVSLDAKQVDDEGREGSLAAREIAGRQQKERSRRSAGDQPQAQEFWAWQGVHVQATAATELRAYTQAAASCTCCWLRRKVYALPHAPVRSKPTSMHERSSLAGAAAGFVLKCWLPGAFAMLSSSTQQ
jgi:hypothetical protein